MTVLADRLVEVRTMRGVTAAVIASRADLTPAMLSAYENSVAVPKLDGLVRIADALQIDLDFLVGRTGSPRSISVSENVCRLIARVSALSEADRRLADIFLDTVENQRIGKPPDPMVAIRGRIELVREQQKRDRENN